MRAYSHTHCTYAQDNSRQSSQQQEYLHDDIFASRYIGAPIGRGLSPSSSSISNLLDAVFANPAQVALQLLAAAANFVQLILGVDYPAFVAVNLRKDTCLEGLGCQRRENRNC